MTGQKWVYRFSNITCDGEAGLRGLLGGKGANLAEMCRLGLPVPPGFTITTEICSAYLERDGVYPDGLQDQVNAALTFVGEAVGRKFGDAEKPLLLSVRSGARASMPGMMDTILNLGLNDVTVAGLAALSGDERFAYDSYRRFIQMYGDVVLEVPAQDFEEILDDFKDDAGLDGDTDLSAEQWRVVIDAYKALIVKETGQPFSQDVHDQLWRAIGAVFGSWNSQRAQTYRRLNGIPDDWGTAVNIQAMVFGNMGERSATGVAFTRNPSTGEKALFGEFLVNAQGEDVVAGIRTPLPLTEADRRAGNSQGPSLEALMPEAFGQLTGIFATLEKHYRDMQDLEFTIQDGRLWMLQTRAGKRTINAALKIAVDMADEGLITRDEAINRIDPATLDRLLHPRLDPDARRDVLASGLPASPGAACGAIVFDPSVAEQYANAGTDVILVRAETSPEDIHGMYAAQGILTTRGGMTSHAAVVARGMGKPCVSGASGLHLDYARKTLTVGGREFAEGDLITIDGSTGQVMAGRVATIKPDMSQDFATIMSWADRKRRLGVRTNADTPADAQLARSFGAQGIGLCRTEHMFFDNRRISAVREMILADQEAGRRQALAKLLPMQRADFLALFEIMAGLPVTIRLLDLPLHEFLPHASHDIDDLAGSLGVAVEVLRNRINELQEFNPMLGHRGCRLAISYPEIAEMQARAIFEAVVEMAKRHGKPPVPEVMIPLIATRAELSTIRKLVIKVAEAVKRESGQDFAYLVGTMIELPRACLVAGDIAAEAEFFSFGTNDLTQTTFGVSRDDSASFLRHYTDQGLLKTDPFTSIDVDGVGQLVRMAVRNGRASRPELKLGVCGEHGGDPDSVHFCHNAGLDYVSCSPYRVPIARLAAAQAALREDTTDKNA